MGYYITVTVRESGQKFKVSDEFTQEHQEQQFLIQTSFSICYGTQKSTYNIPKR